MIEAFFYLALTYIDNRYFILPKKKMILFPLTDASAESRRDDPAPEDIHGNAYLGQVRVVLKPVIPKILTDLAIKPTFVLSFKNKCFKNCPNPDCLDVSITNYYRINHPFHDLYEFICLKCYHSTVLVWEEAVKSSTQRDFFLDHLKLLNIIAKEIL